jgi:hypothetical protein
VLASYGILASTRSYRDDLDTLACLSAGQQSFLRLRALFRVLEGQWLVNSPQLTNRACWSGGSLSEDHGIARCTASAVLLLKHPSKMKHPSSHARSGSFSSQEQYNPSTCPVHVNGRLFLDIPQAADSRTQGHFRGPSPQDVAIRGLTQALVRFQAYILTYTIPAVDLAVGSGVRVVAGAWVCVALLSAGAAYVPGTFSCPVRSTCVRTDVCSIWYGPYY